MLLHLLLLCCLQDRQEVDSMRAVQHSAQVLPDSKQQ